MHITRSASYAAFRLSSWPLTFSLNCVNNYIMCGFSFLDEKQHILRSGNCFSFKFNQLLKGQNMLLFHTLVMHQQQYEKSQYILVFHFLRASVAFAGLWSSWTDESHIW